MKDLKSFISKIQDTLETKDFIKLTLSKKRVSTNDLKNVFIKPVKLKDGWKLSFVYRFPTKDITKNHVFSESIDLIAKMLNNDFYNADLFTLRGSVHLLSDKSNRIKFIEKSSELAKNQSFFHDKIKNRFVKTMGNVYLRDLGVLTSEFKVKNDMQDKFRQIDKYIEIIDSVVRSAKLDSGLKIVDMGCGKGYLTFALYDYLQNSLDLNPEITGVESRKELVEACNTIATTAGFNKLKFQCGTIENAELPKFEMLIALHACDTATDEAIFRGIQSKADVIIVAPCCHKQLRKQINPEYPLKAISKFGILKERQNEILTDAIRALILEAYGYQTKVFEFIATEHTPKNILIVAIKKTIQNDFNIEIQNQLNNLKKLYNIEYHQLEKLLNLC